MLLLPVVLLLAVVVRQLLRVGLWWPRWLSVVKGRRHCSCKRLLLQVVDSFTKAALQCMHNKTQYVSCADADSSWRTSIYTAADLEQLGRLIIINEWH